MTNARKAKVDFITTIQDEEEFYEHIKVTNRKVTIVDIYTHWCGP